MIKAYFIIGIVWFLFVTGYQRSRYDEKFPHFTDNWIEHLLLWPVGLGHYVKTGIIRFEDGSSENEEDE